MVTQKRTKGKEQKDKQSTHDQHLDAPQQHRINRGGTQSTAASTTASIEQASLPSAPIMHIHPTKKTYPHSSLGNTNMQLPWNNPGDPCLSRSQSTEHASGFKRRPPQVPSIVQSLALGHQSAKKCDTTNNPSAWDTVLIAIVRVLTLWMWYPHRLGHKSIYRHRGKIHLE